MNKTTIEKHLNQKVTLRLNYEEKERTGYLRSTNDERFHENPNIKYKPNFYFLTEQENVTAKSTTSIIFPSSHIKTLKG